jgi:FKBP-type peptidyl-prolyl cis-trans isomerase (trigger factor)
MKVTATRSKENKMILDVEVPSDRVKKKFDEIYEKIGQDVKIPGFRPGKAPRHVLEQHHSKLAREEVMKNLISETYSESVKSESVDVIDVPEIAEVKLESDILTYRATVEIKPEIKIKQYKGLKLKKNEIKIEPSEIEETLKQLKKTRPDVDDARLAKGLGYRTKEELFDCLNKQLYLKKENEERARLERDLINQLVSLSSFVAPASLVAKRLHELKHQAEHQMAEYGLAEDNIKKRLEEFEPKFKTEAEEQVKVFLILEEIGKCEKMQADDQLVNRVIEFLFAEAEWN